ncbi:MAG TPA: FABP family protein [Actinomycetota bacterium]
MGTVHPDVASLGFLLGRWRGAGRGEYPTIDPFDYEEEVVVEHAGDAWLGYGQTSWDPSTGAALHWERGFLRPGAEPGAVELVLAHPIGVVEVAHGHVDGHALTLTTGDGRIGRTRTALDVAALVRRYQVEGPELSYEIDMATDRTPMTRHLVATLRRRP